MSVAASGMTVNEQKQQLSIAYVHAVAARAGYTCQFKNVDNDSIDLQVAARGLVHERAVARSPMIDIQLKATSLAVLKERHLPFPLPVKNYNDLRAPAFTPRVLVVLLLPEEDDRWLEQSEEAMITRHCAYWMTLLNKPETPNQTSVTVHVPRDQQFTVSALRLLMEKVSRREEL